MTDHNMSPFSSEEFARSAVRTLQIIVFALAMGPICFAAVAISNRFQKPPEQDVMIAYLSVGFAAVLMIVRLIVGPIVVARSRKQIAAGTFPFNLPSACSQVPANPVDGDRFLGVFQQKTIIESALLEGAMFMNIFALMSAGHWWSLAVAGVLLAVNVVPFPTYDRVENWVKYQLEIMELEKGRIV
jgi:hypothetical protein